MKYVEAFSTDHLSHWDDSSARSLFLAGGISDCHDWQADVVRQLEQAMRIR